MTKFVKLNPYQNISTEVDAFISKNWDVIKALCLREAPNKMGMIRECNITKEIENAAGMIVGYINIHLLNDKYGVHNLRTDMGKHRFNNQLHSVNDLSNAESFNEVVIDPANRIQVRLTIKQYQTKAIGLSDVTHSTIFRMNDTVDEVVSAIRNKTATSLLWDDVGYVLATRKFFNEALPVLNVWVPEAKDITTQTLYQPA